MKVTRTKPAVVARVHPTPETRSLRLIALYAVAAVAAAIFALSQVTAAHAEDVAAGAPKDEWPCVWRKVVTLDAATIWDGPSIETGKKWRNDNDVRKLSQYLILRRIPVEEVEKDIQEFAKTLPADVRDQRLTELFTGVLERTNTDRRQVISGIERFHKRQLERAEKIEKAGLKIPEIELSNEPISATEIDKLTPDQERFNWDVRVFTERQENMPLACEIPQLMNERAGAIARAIRAEMSE